MIDFSTLQGLTIPEGVVTQITDANSRVIWAVKSGGKAVLQVEKITSDTYAGETAYTGEQFILLDIYPKTNGTVKVTYGGLTKTITDTIGAAEPNAQQVFFGTFNGVSDGVTTPTSGELTIEGDYYAFGSGAYSQSKMISNISAKCITSVIDFGCVTLIPVRACMAMLCETIKIPNGVIKIDSGAFESCVNLNKVAIPKSVSIIVGNPWRLCDCAVNPIVVDNANLAYRIDGNCLIEIATNKLVCGFGDAVVPSYVTTIQDYSFDSITNLKNVVIPSTVKTIAGAAFNGCSNLTSVTIQEGVEDIGGNAFLGCSALKSLTIPASVKSVGHCPFDKSLMTLTMLATTPPTCTSSASKKMIFPSSSTATIIVPKGCGEAYKAAEVWSKYADQIVEDS